MGLETTSGTDAEKVVCADSVVLLVSSVLSMHADGVGPRCSLRMSTRLINRSLLGERPPEPDLGASLEQELTMRCWIKLGLAVDQHRRQGGQGQVCDSHAVD